MVVTEQKARAVAFSLLEMVMDHKEAGCDHCSRLLAEAYKKRDAIAPDAADDEILKLIRELPPDHTYRIHFLEHIDWPGKRLVRLDPKCKYCDIYKRHPTQEL